MTDQERQELEKRIEALRRSMIDHLRASQTGALAALDQARKVVEYDHAVVEKLFLQLTADLQEQVIAIYTAHQKLREAASCNGNTPEQAPANQEASHG